LKAPPQVAIFFGCGGDEKDVTGGRHRPAAGAPFLTISDLQAERQ
jgi:hypothetical protein